MGNCNDFVSGCPIPIRPVQPGRRLPREDRVPRRHVRPAVDGRPDLHDDKCRGRRHRRTERRLLDHSSACPPPPHHHRRNSCLSPLPISFARPVHVFQVNGGSLWHKWSSDAFNWSNEETYFARRVSPNNRCPISCPESPASVTASCARSRTATGGLGSSLSLPAVHGEW